MKKLVVLLGLMAFVIIVALNPAKKREQAPDPGPGAKVERPAKATRSEREHSPDAQTAADPERLAEATAAIDAAVVTYSPEGVKAIRPYLLDPAREVRQAARDGLVQLGESDAIPFLRDAASRMEDPAEIASLHEAADLLALPAWSETEEAREVVSEIIGEESR